MSPLSGFTDGFPMFFVLPAIFVVLVGVMVTVGIVMFFVRLTRNASDPTPIIRSVAEDAATSSRRRRALELQMQQNQQMQELPQQLQFQQQLSGNSPTGMP